MSSVLYIFAGFPGKNLPPPAKHLNTGGLAHCIEVVEELGMIDWRNYVRPGGLFTGNGDKAEWLGPVECRISDLCVRDGIDLGWFPPWWEFNDGLTIHQAYASKRYRTVVHGTELSFDQFLEQNGPTCLADIKVERAQIWKEEWAQYEARWRLGACPQEDHIVHLTWMLMEHKLPEFAYKRIRALVEDAAVPKDLQLYSTEPGKHFSESSIWDGKPDFEIRGKR